MSFLTIPNVKITGIASCVPQERIDNKLSHLFASSDDADRFIETTGIEYRRIVGNTGICTSDLCFQAAEKLLEDLNWNKNDVDCLIFVTQTPDYILPATSCILQDRLGLSKDCYALDISLGCSGWVYGLSVISALMQSGSFKKGLLLAGDTTTVTKSPKDKSTFPLFGDAGTATSLEYENGAEDLKFHFGTDGSGFESIIIKDGGFRHPFTEKSLIEKEFDNGIVRNDLQSSLNGANVFTFGIGKAPRSVKALLEHFELKTEEIDFAIFHQANKMMNEKIRTKLAFPENKVPYSIGEFGNTSSASIPLTINLRLKEEVENRKNKFIACGFGVGLSWGSVYFETENIVCPEIQDYKLNKNGK